MAKIGLTLSGGAAYGYAHLQILRAFEDAGLKPHCITGTSIGALVGATWAAGHSVADILEHGNKQFSQKGATLSLVSKLVPAHFSSTWARGHLMSLDAETILGLLMPPLPDSLESLEVAMRIVSTDFSTGQARVHDHGDLRKAVAASIAIPGVFKPVNVEGRPHLDGGLVCPMPLEYLDETCDFIIASQVTATKPGIDKPPRRISLLDVGIGTVEIVSHHLTRQSVSLRPPDVLCCFDNAKFSPSDFAKGEAIYTANEIAYEQTLAALNVLKIASHECVKL